MTSRTYRDNLQWFRVIWMMIVIGLISANITLKFGSWWHTPSTFFYSYSIMGSYFVLMSLPISNRGLLMRFFAGFCLVVSRYLLRVCLSAFKSKIFPFFTLPPGFDFFLPVFGLPVCTPLFFAAFFTVRLDTALNSFIGKVFTFIFPLFALGTLFHFTSKTKTPPQARRCCRGSNQRAFGGANRIISDIQLNKKRALLGITASTRDIIAQMS